MKAEKPQAVVFADNNQLPPLTKSKFSVSHGPLAVAMSRNRAPVAKASPVVTLSAAHNDLKRKQSPAKPPVMKQHTPSNGKSNSAGNAVDIWYDSDEDDRSILYKTAFHEFPISSSDESDESGKSPPPKAAARGRRLVSRK